MSRSFICQGHMKYGFRGEVLIRTVDGQTDDRQNSILKPHIEPRSGELKIEYPILASLNHQAKEMLLLVPHSIISLTLLITGSQVPLYCAHITHL